VLQNKNQVVFTNKALCRDCYRCVRVCPVNAIRMQNSQAQVIDERCISCGTCVAECPQKAKAYINDLEKVLEMLRAGDKLAVSLAPSYVALFDGWKHDRLPSALRSIGFSYIAETATGAYYTAQQTRWHIEQNPGKPHIATACPAVVNYIEKYANQYLQYMVPVVSPMIAHAKLLKRQLPDHKIVFIGPCIAKINEQRRFSTRGFVDAAITFEQLNELLKYKKIELDACETSSFDETPGESARLFPLEGGLLRTAGLEADTFSTRILAVSGFREVADALEILGKTNENLIIEPLFCKNGCINGPVIPEKKNTFHNRNEVINYNQNRTTLQNLAELEPRFLTTSFEYQPPKTPTEFTEQQIREVLKKTGNDNPEFELNCGSCGYPDCRSKAVAVLQGIAEVEMCMPYMRRLAEQKTDLLIERSPNGIVILDKSLQIIKMNLAFKQMFCCTDSIVGKPISYLVDPEPFEKLVVGNETLIKQEVKYPTYNLVCHQLCYPLHEENRIIGIFVNITEDKHNKERLNEIKTEAIIQAQELIEHQINMAQDIAKFLGDSAAKGEILMHKLIDAVNN